MGRRSFTAAEKAAIVAESYDGGEDSICGVARRHPQSRLDGLLPWAYPTIPGHNAAA